MGKKISYGKFLPRTPETVKNKYAIPNPSKKCICGKLIKRYDEDVIEVDTGDGAITCLKDLKLYHTKCWEKRHNSKPPPPLRTPEKILLNILKNDEQGGVVCHLNR